MNQHPDCTSQGHISGLAALDLMVFPFKGDPHPAVERCDECASLGNDWDDIDAQRAVKEYDVLVSPTYKEPQT